MTALLLPDRWAEFDLHFHSGQLTDHLPEGWTQPDCARSEAAPLHIVSVRLGWKEIHWSLGWRLTVA